MTKAAHRHFEYSYKNSKNIQKSALQKMFSSHFIGFPLLSTVFCACELFSFSLILIIMLTRSTLEAYSFCISEYGSLHIHLSNDSEAAFAQHKNAVSKPSH